jgi:hypothetical protein
MCFGLLYGAMCLLWVSIPQESKLPGISNCQAVAMHVPSLKGQDHAVAASFFQEDYIKNE